MAGWIKLHRKLKNSLVFDNPDLLKVWIWCLLKATHDDYIQMIGLQEVELEKGQFIFGRKVAANELKMSESKTYRLIKKLENNAKEFEHQNEQQIFYYNYCKLGTLSI